MGGCDPPCTYDDLKKVVGLPGRPVFPGHHGGASGIATQGLKTVSLKRERELRHPEIGPLPRGSPSLRPTQRRPRVSARRRPGLRLPPPPFRKRELLPRSQAEQAWTLRPPNGPHQRRPCFPPPVSGNTQVHEPLTRTPGERTAPRPRAPFISERRGRSQAADSAPTYWLMLTPV